MEENNASDDVARDLEGQGRQWNWMKLTGKVERSEARRGEAGSVHGEASGKVYVHFRSDRSSGVLSKNESVCCL